MDESTSRFSFVRMAAVCLRICRPTSRRVDRTDYLAIRSGITLDFIEKVESFSEDFARVIEHARVSRQLREVIGARITMSQHLPCQDYYTSALSDRVYRAYERDFDRLRHPRTVSI
jgi:hypothetical protein